MSSDCNHEIVCKNCDQRNARRLPGDECDYCGGLCVCVICHAKDVPMEDEEVK